MLDGLSNVKLDSPHIQILSAVTSDLAFQSRLAVKGGPDNDPYAPVQVTLHTKKDGSDQAGGTVYYATEVDDLMGVSNPYGQQSVSAWPLTPGDYVFWATRGPLLAKKQHRTVLAKHLQDLDIDVP
jgi:hypothetical protein